MDTETYDICLNIAKGCHDYNGGHHDKQANEIYHHGIQTVINCLEALKTKGLEDTQLSVVYEIGRNAHISKDRQNALYAELHSILIDFAENPKIESKEAIERISAIYGDYKGQGIPKG